eukprot:NODE_31_length_32452_cov_0.352672.p23 type:complete len:126 gc:universal NODE_31_length_32452_cov_0.352672:8551-8928(+)
MSQMQLTTTIRWPVMYYIFWTILSWYLFVYKLRILLEFRHWQDNFRCNYVVHTRIILLENEFNSDGSESFYIISKPALRTARETYGLAGFHMATIANKLSNNSREIPEIDEQLRRSTRANTIISL